MTAVLFHRRFIPEEPPSRLAFWSRRLAVFAFVVALIAVVIVRGGFVEAVPGMVVLGGALALASLAITFALAAFVVIWVNGNPGLGKAVAGLLIGIGLVAYPAYVVARGYGLPALNDVTTDTNDPPQFDTIARIRPREANPVAYAGASAAQKQREAYPDLAPLTLAITPAEAYNATLEVLARRKWRIVDARAPSNRRDGRIEAVAFTLVMGFRDDVVIRVRGRGGGAVVDIRSASRYGSRDLGSNAERVRSLLEEIEEEVGTQPAARR